MSHTSTPSRASSPKDARAVRSSKALRDALLHLLEQKPFDQITVRDICATASIHYATFFRHHPSKEALLEHVAADQIATVVDLSMRIDVGIGDETAFRAICQYIDEHRALWTVLLNGGAGPAMREEWLKKAKAVAAEREPLGSWLPKDLGTICSVAIIVETLSWWLDQPRESFTISDIAGYLHKLLSKSTLAAD
ncbi:TetR/AcrR family transcriptional regulator [Novosphingobium sp. BL-8A]|uniref:TetR/AcrR family transcriptional regulator n=1 Tax=Novosphingobium sp. BL-8A TaxID=3127639 RepID=UPI0037564FC3